MSGFDVLLLQCLRGEGVAHRRVALTGLLMAASVLCSAVPCAAGDEPEKLLGRWMALYRERAQSIDMRPADDPERRFDQHAAPLLKYTNPVRSVQQHGSVFLWTRQGRPAVIASIWSAIDRDQPEMRRINFEWHSLCKEAVIAERSDQRLWNSSEPGIIWQTFRGSPAVAGSRRLRLLQMRQMARSLSARIKTSESELRLMPQPLYRYPERTSGATDGAVFAFVMGTDPEVFALIEAGPGDDGKPQWRLGLARFTNFPLTVKQGDRELWSCEMARPFQRTGKYFLWFAVEKLPLDLPDRSTERLNEP